MATDVATKPAKTVETDPKKIHEVWESMVPGTCWVWTRDPRRPGEYTKTRVGGRGGGSKRLRITTDERRYHEEQVIDEMNDSNPFRNGALRLVSIDDGGEVVDDIHTNYHLTDTQLIEYFEVKDEDVFKGAMDDIGSELILRRIFSLAEKNGSVSQHAVLRDLLEERYKMGGTQRTVREMIAAGEAIGGEVLS